MDYCKDNNRYEQFIIKNGKFCAQFDNSKCLGDKFKIIPSALESPRYEHLICSSIFADLGYKCCYNPDTKIEYVDEIGNWGIENGKLCGIGY
ncbi:Non-catalytic module family DOC2, partial [Piromyces sp. E2]